MSANQIQRLAFAAYNDQVDLLQRVNKDRVHISSALAALAALGTWGRYPNNMSRELEVYLGVPHIPPPTNVSIPVVVQKPRKLQPKVQRHDLPFMLPHVLFAHLYKHNRQIFDDIILGATRGHGTRVSEFWRGVVTRRDPRIRYHPMCGRSGWIEHAVPISLHGDAVPCVSVGHAGVKSLDAYSWQSVLADGTTTHIKHYVFGMFEQSKAHLGEHGVDSNDAMWRVIVWSLNALFDGRWPAKDWNDQPWPHGSSEAALSGEYLADGFFAVVWLLKGDLDYFAKALKLRHYAAHELCDFCPCTKDETKPTSA